MTYEIKPVTEMDRSWVVTVAGKRMIKDEVKRPDLYNPQQLHLIFNKVIQDGTGLVCWKDGVRVGAVGGLLMDHFLAPGKKLMMEVVWYLKEDCRNTRAPLLMLKGYKQLVEEKADEGIFTLLPNSPVKDETLSRYGFHLNEKQYIFRK